MRPDWFVVGDATALADVLVRSVGRVVAARPVGGSWSLALPGGSVIDRLVRPLARAELPWEAAHVFFVDERAVSPDVPDSNWRVCRAAAEGTRMADARWHRLPADASDLARAVAGYASELTEVAGTPPQLDVVLLGVGEDGHVASLFPDHPALAAADLVIIERDAPKRPAVRLSMSLDVLAHARLTCVAAFGAGKQGAVRAALDPSSAWPVARLVRRARQPLVLADRAAAG
jgi:6-phosphogluconolactonase